MKPKKVSKKAAAIRAVREEVPNGVGTALIAEPALEVHGLGLLKVTSIEYDPTEPVFVVEGEFTIAAVKQLLAGTVFTLKLDKATPCSNCCKDPCAKLSACPVVRPDEYRTAETFPPTATKCSICKTPQYFTPGGWSCSNGHGGAPPLD